MAPVGPSGAVGAAIRSRGIRGMPPPLKNLRKGCLFLQPRLYFGAFYGLKRRLFLYKLYKT